MKAYAKTIVFCPMEAKEVNARNCKDCRWFGGIGISETQTVFVECKYEEGRGEKNVIPDLQDE